MTDLSKIGERERLKPKPGDEPHWQRLRACAYLGYRPSKRGGRGTWFARAYDADTGKYRRRPLGDYGSSLGHEVFATARKDAESWAEQVETGGVRSAKLETVADACLAYLKVRPGAIAEGVFRRQVFADPVAKVKLSKLRRHHLHDWRCRLAETPAMISRTKYGQQRTKPRSAATVNRDMVPLRAALGRVLSPGTPNTDAAWQEALKPEPGADRRRDLYLDRAERARLLEQTSAEAAPFVRALCLLPLRPGALASLSVRDFEKRTRTLTIGKDKHGRPRQITVPPVIADFLSTQVKDKLPSTPLFTRSDGRPWSKDAWKLPIKAAISLARLPSGAAAYTLRHSVITDLIRSGLPALTVAQLSGTSITMIERHYGHLVRDDAEHALALLAL
ncbi:tyrosine-type recombinase/integrase [Sphingomonas sp. LY160]|uniref:tyrosine-type recombinase/integrase n=1 Tax=Sphingomonas sp. LY160 TaxID=3095342 RepID=UPI002ADEEE99|nr:tyrosine-type recombinase/integrase [Sphingomonas sp. LY160]MEA1071087.1 tyrosine-type recombinase/integrase [Sphingomonas sp. LY160]